MYFVYFVLFGDQTVCTVPIPRHTGGKHMLTVSVAVAHCRK